MRRSQEDAGTAEGEVGVLAWCLRDGSDKTICGNLFGDDVTHGVRDQRLDEVDTRFRVVRRYAADCVRRDFDFRAIPGIIPAAIASRALAPKIGK